MSQRLVVIGDLHLDAQIAGRDYHADVLEKLRSVDVRPGDIVVQLGDVCDPDNGARTWRALDSMNGWLGRLPSQCNAFVLVGNHDRIDDARADSCIQTIGWTSSRIMDGIEVAPLGRMDVQGLFLPWLSRAQGEIKILEDATFLMDQQGPDVRFIVFCHLDIEGAMPGSEADLPRLGRQVLPQELVDDPRVLKVFAGHLHTPGRIGDKIEVVGSLECLGMGERDATDKGWLEVEL